MKIINIIAFIVGLLLGSGLLLSAVFVYVKRQIFGVGGIVLVVFGSFLIGLSIWTSFEISVNSDGTIKAKYNQATKEEIGVKAAEVNGSIEQLKLKLSNLTQDVLTLKRAVPGVTFSRDKTLEREKKEKLFENNSEYSILVFYKPYQRDISVKLSNMLLSLGFKSSATSTELKEAARQFKPNKAWIIYTPKGEKKIPELKKFLSSSGTSIEYIYRNSSYALRSGDIQILIF